MPQIAEQIIEIGNILHSKDSGVNYQVTAIGWSTFLAVPIDSNYTPQLYGERQFFLAGGDKNWFFLA